MNPTKFYQIKDYYKYLKNPDKYIGTRPLTLRSRWEITVVKSFFDVNTNIVEWSSESIKIPYYLDLDKKFHRYYPDFYMKLKNGKEYIIEVKPHQFLKPPQRKRKTKTYNQLMEQYIKNTAKWNAAKEFCKEMNKRGRDIQFTILTEKEIYANSK